jgi:hypothetical protein
MPELLEEMERELGRLRSAARSDGAVWRNTVQASAAVLARGVADLLDTLKLDSPKADAGPAPAANPEAHLRAQRFARVRVAEIQLYQSPQVKMGRASGDLYGVLKTVLDAARSAYTEQFLTPVNGIPDYLHHELVKVLANNDAKLLGSQYPGPLV